MNYENIMPIIHVLTGGFIAYLGGWLLQNKRRRQLEKDFKEGIITELIEFLPQLVSHYVNENLDEKGLNWSNTIFSRIEKGITQEDKEYFENIKKGITSMIKRKSKKEGAPQQLNLSILNEPIQSFALLNSNLRSKIIHIRTNISRINNLIKHCLASYYSFGELTDDKTTEQIKRDILRSKKLISIISFETAEIIAKII
jgi:hypothetical protein